MGIDIKSDQDIEQIDDYYRDWQTKMIQLLKKIEQNTRPRI